jgi:Ohr subfamily peroxiredoxin
MIRTKKIKTGITTTRAHVKLGKVENGSFGLAVTLEVNVPGVEQEVAQQIVEAAHQVCPYSNATRGNIEVELLVTTYEKASM